MTDIAKLGLEIETKGAEEATRQLNDLDKAAQSAAQGADKLSDSAQDMSGSLDQAGSAADQAGGFFGEIGKEVLKAEVAIQLAEKALSAIYETLKAGIQAYAEYEVATVQLTQSFERVGNQTGFTIKQLQEYAGQLESTSGVAEESIMRIAQVLNRAGKASGKEFKDLMALSLDLASAMGGDPVNAAEQLARALKDPERAVAMLRRQFADFDPIVADTIERMAQAGDTAGATALLFSELESTIGGSAAAAADTMAGAWARLQDAMSDAAREFITVTRIGEALTAAINVMTSAVKAVADIINGTIGIVRDFADSINTSATAAGVAANAYNGMQTAVKGLQLAYYLATGQISNFTIALAQANAEKAAQAAVDSGAEARVEKMKAGWRSFTDNIKEGLDYTRRLGKVILENNATEEQQVRLLRMGSKEREIATAGTSAYEQAKKRLTAELGRFGVAEENEAKRSQAAAEALARLNQQLNAAAGGHGRAGSAASRHASAMRELEDPLTKTVDDLNDYIRSLEREAELAGLTGVARDQRIAEMRIEDTITRQLGDANDDLAKAYGDRAKAAIQAAEDAREAIDREREAMETAQRAQEDAFNAFTDFATSVINGSEDMGQALGNLLIKLVEIYFQMQLMQNMGGGLGGGGGMFGFLGELFGFGGGSTAIDWAAEGMWGISRGAAFNRGAMIPFARGGTVDRPSMRAMALMGEAGPEAVLPLRRDAAGNLGVGSSGEGGVKVVVQNIDQRRGGGTMETQSERGSDGTTYIRTYIRDEVKRSLSDGSMDREMGRNYGLQRNPTRR